MFLWLQDFVLLQTVRMMINGYDDPALHLTCHKGSRNMPWAYRRFGVSEQELHLACPAVLGPH